MICPLMKRCVCIINLLNAFKDSVSLQFQTVVELASDHREFATALAKTKLVEMSGRAKIVPIPEPAPPSSQTSGSLNSLPPPPFVVQTRHAGEVSWGQEDLTACL